MDLDCFRAVPVGLSRVSFQRFDGPVASGMPGSPSKKFGHSVTHRADHFRKLKYYLSHASLFQVDIIK